MELSSTATSTEDPVSKKTVLKETPTINLVESPKREEPKSELLREFFTNIINRKILHLKSRKVTEVLTDELEIDMKSISTRMKYVLSESLCYFMKVWPGWSNPDMQNPMLTEERFLKFKDYLKFKIKYIIDNEQQFFIDNFGHKKEMVSSETQTESPGKVNKPEAPFSLVISGQPSVLNNIVFVEVDNNIVIKQHLEKQWKQLAPMQFFINHPYVKVTVNIPGVRFTRCNVHLYKRYITECGDTASCPDFDFITNVVNTVPNSTPKVYSYDFIMAYFRQLINLANKHNVINRNLLQAIIGEFLQDIKDCNLHGGSMAEPFMVTFNIGGNAYVRNKKMVISNSKSKDANAINFCEILIPKVSFTLQEFNVNEAVQAPEVSFIELNKIEGSVEDTVSFINELNNSVTFHCTLCNKSYFGERSYVDCMDHFRFLHKGEQAVLCFKCRKPFEVTQLAATRWGHTCEMIKSENSNAVVSVV